MPEAVDFEPFHDRVLVRQDEAAGDLPEGSSGPLGVDVDAQPEDDGRDEQGTVRLLGNLG